MSNPLTSLSGFPRSPGEKNLQTRRSINRLAGLGAVLFRKDFAQAGVVAGDTVAGTAAETAFTDGYTYPANALAPGNVIEIAARGIYSCVGPPTLRMKWKLGTAVLLDTAAFTLASVATNALWTFDALAVVQTVGASGTIEAQGVLRALLAPSGAQTVQLVNTATIVVDTTGTLLSRLTVQWGTSSASNTITQRMLVHKTLP